MSDTSKQIPTNHATADNSAWLAKHTEPVLEPELPICDPHHHLWDQAAQRYMVEELLGDVYAGHNVVSTVFVECMSMYRAGGPEALRPVGETEFVNGVAAMSASGNYGKARVCAGIVSYADLALGASVEAVLEAHLDAGGGRFRGIRDASAHDPSSSIRRGHTDPGPQRLGTVSFREGFAKLGELGLTYDAWLYHPQIPELIDLARAFPHQPIVLDHVGGPLGIGPYMGKQAEIFPTWQQNIRELAQCPNVHVKLGGLGMKVTGFAFHKQPAPPNSEALATVWRPYIETCIEAFTPRRCMFESNFPVDRAAGTYRTYWNAFKRLAAGASDEEKAWLFHDGAAKFYRLRA